MVKWEVSLKERGHLYFPDQSAASDKVFGAISQAIVDRGNLLGVRATTVKEGFFGKSRPALEVGGLGFTATISSMPVGPDLYIGYVLHHYKEQLNDIQIQNSEAFAEYLSNVLERACKMLGLTIQDSSWE
jgi:hypothetical protein